MPLNRLFSCSPKRPQGEASSARINSVSFHRTADLLVSASDDDAIRVYNTQSGSQERCVWD
jgi:WD40 repeat protein